VLSIFIGIIVALDLVIRGLRSAPIGYESKDGFRFGVPIGWQFWLSS
jgi:hypothetical protein